MYIIYKLNIHNILTICILDQVSEVHNIIVEVLGSQPCIIHDFFGLGLSFLCDPKRNPTPIVRLLQAFDPISLLASLDYILYGENYLKGEI